MAGSVSLSLPLEWFESKVPGGKCQVLAYRYSRTMLEMVNASDNSFEDISGG
jgi:hypothetical protein